MLSRVAERVYWAARYLQRVESSARIVNVYTNLLMDLPKEINISWFNLVSLNNGQEEYDSRYKIRDERNVVKFTLVDDTNPSSMLMSLQQVRENFRTTRDVIPESAWELINELNSFVKESIDGGALSRAKRDEFLTQVINQCQMMQGYVDNTMSHDSAWELWSIGRALERADMTTRILEAGAGILLDETSAEKVQAPLVVWGNVLKSSSAHYAYRRAVAASVRGEKVANFLVFDQQFPCSLAYCLSDIKSSVKQLPKRRKVLEEIVQVETFLDESKMFKKIDEKFIQYMNKLQLKSAGLHQAFSDTWFSLD